ncbi:MAG: hypothetical protein MK135_07480 [Polyangiaceae bacterium]|nr:hypothetical protein [Polyangiaceae bacterium]
MAGLKIAVLVSGSDAGRSGLGSYFKGVIPPLAHHCAAQGHELLLVGAADDLGLFQELPGEVEKLFLPRLFFSAALGAAWHLGF